MAAKPMIVLGPELGTHAPRTISRRVPQYPRRMRSAARGPGPGVVGELTVAQEIPTVSCRETTAVRGYSLHQYLLN